MLTQSHKVVLAFFTFFIITNQILATKVCKGGWSFNVEYDEGVCSLDLPQQSDQLECVRSKCSVPNRKDQLVTMADCFDSNGSGPSQLNCESYAYLPTSKKFGCIIGSSSYTCGENPDGIAYIRCPDKACRLPWNEDILGEFDMGLGPHTSI